MPDFLDYYAILQVSTHATLKEIKTAFRRLARRYHPDLNPNDPKAAIKFQEIYEAYAVLGDSLTRSRYDQKRQENKPPTTAASPSFSAQDYYVQGIKQALLGHYLEAIKQYTQAISLDPRFLAAYLKRAEAYFKVRKDQQVLEDCYQALLLDKNCFDAYYYQGRVRKRLGYLSSSIEAYTQAIRLNPQSAFAHYHRGLAYQELKQKKPAIEDFKRATKQFREQGDKEGYDLATNQILLLQKRQLLIQIGFECLDFFKLLLITPLQVLLNPSAEILPLFVRLEKHQLLSLGFFYGFISEAVMSLWFPKLQFLFLLSWLILTLSGFLGNLLLLSRLQFLGTLFISSLTLIPIIFVGGIIYYFQPLNLPAYLVLLIFASFLTMLFLYISYTQVLGFSERQAIYLVPTILTLASLPIFLKIT